MTDRTEHLTSRLGGDSVAIFLFHGVVRKSDYRVRNYTRKHLEAAEFQAIVAALAGAGTPLSMEDVLEHCRTATPFPPRAFAVTFDDGFENNVSVAAPILADHRVPATVYVTSGFVEHNGMSWIDRIEYCLERRPAGRLRLPWAPEPRSWSDRESAIAVLDDIRRHVKSDPRLVPDEVVATVFEQCGMEPVAASDDPLDLKMSWEQARALAATDGFIVGGHSHTHAVLSFLSPDALELELEASFGLMSDRAGLDCRHYSYPEGLAHCYSDGVIAALKARGVACCPTAEDGVNRPDADPFRLKRIMVA